MKKKLEILLLRFAHWVLYKRNVPRSPYISRSDNNRLFGFGEELEQIIERIKSDYQ